KSVDPFRARPPLSSFYDFGERLRIEACAAYQSAVDLRLSNQALDVVRLDASPIQNPELLCRFTSKSLFSFGANERVGLRCYLRGRCLPGTDCPNRLVSHSDVCKLLLG